MEIADIEHAVRAVILTAAFDGPSYTVIVIPEPERTPVGAVQQVVCDGHGVVPAAFLTIHLQ